MKIYNKILGIAFLFLGCTLCGMDKQTALNLVTALSSPNLTQVVIVDQEAHADFLLEGGMFSEKLTRIAEVDLPAYFLRLVKEYMLNQKRNKEQTELAPKQMKKIEEVALRVKGIFQENNHLPVAPDVVEGLKQTKCKVRGFEVAYSVLKDALPKEASQGKVDIDASQTFEPPPPPSLSFEEYLKTQNSQPENTTAPSAEGPSNSQGQLTSNADTQQTNQLLDELSACINKRTTERVVFVDPLTTKKQNGPNSIIVTQLKKIIQNSPAGNLSGAGSNSDDSAGAFVDTPEDQERMRRQREAAEEAEKEEKARKAVEKAAAEARKATGEPEFFVIDEKERTPFGTRKRAKQSPASTEASQQLKDEQPKDGSRFGVVLRTTGKLAQIQPTTTTQESIPDAVSGVDPRVRTGSAMGLGTINPPAATQAQAKEVKKKGSTVQAPPQVAKDPTTIAEEQPNPGSGVAPKKAAAGPVPAKSVTPGKQPGKLAPKAAPQPGSIPASGSSQSGQGTQTLPVQQGGPGNSQNRPPQQPAQQTGVPVQGAKPQPTPPPAGVNQQPVKPTEQLSLGTVLSVTAVVVLGIWAFKTDHWDPRHKSQGDIALAV